MKQKQVGRLMVASTILHLARFSLEVFFGSVDILPVWDRLLLPWMRCVPYLHKTAERWAVKVTNLFDSSYLLANTIRG